MDTSSKYQLYEYYSTLLYGKADRHIICSRTIVGLQNRTRYTPYSVHSIVCYYRNVPLFLLSKLLGSLLRKSINSRTVHEVPCGSSPPTYPYRTRTSYSLVTASLLRYHTPYIILPYSIQPCYHHAYVIDLRDN